MSNTDRTDVSEVIIECERCGETMLAAYLEDGLCRQCRGSSFGRGADPTD